MPRSSESVPHGAPHESRASARFLQLTLLLQIPATVSQGPKSTPYSCPPPTLAPHTAPHALYFSRSTPYMYCSIPSHPAIHLALCPSPRSHEARCRLGVPSKDCERLFDPTPRPSIAVTWFRQKIEVLAFRLCLREWMRDVKNWKLDSRRCHSLLQVSESSRWDDDGVCFDSGPSVGTRIRTF